MKRENVLGNTYGRLTIISADLPHEGSGRKVECLCECGNKKLVRLSHLKAGKIKSCGCWHDESAKLVKTTHGLTKTFEHRIWVGMKNRCYNKNSPIYSYYGGRGIKVCDRWKNSFQDFLSDVGFAPSKKHSIDRFPNKDGDYEPNNFRWATDIEQSRNRRSNVIVDINGESMLFIEFCKKYNIKPTAIYYRMKKGETRKQAIIHFIYGQKNSRVVC